MSVEVYSCIVSEVGTNCYLIFDKDEGVYAVVDPGDYSCSLIKKLEAHGIENLDYIFLTHGHFDHIDGVTELKNNYGGSVVISEIDEEAFTNPDISLAVKHLSKAVYPEKADITVKDGDVIPFGSKNIEVIATPGHTEGSVCYKIEDMIFSGDTLFAGTCGRTDFSTGNMLKMLVSLKKLSALDGDYKVFCGHGPATTLNKERQSNPYIRK